METSMVAGGDLLVWLGLAALVVAAGIYFLAAGASGTRDAMDETETTATGEVDGEGYFEVTGDVVCDQPLDTPETDRPTVQYTYQIVAVIEETYRDEDGHRRTRREERILHSETRGVPFQIDDGSGRIHVDPSDARLDPEVLVSRSFEGQMPANVSPPLFGSSERLVERRKVVTGFTVGQWIYCIGPVTAPDGMLSFRGKDPEGRPFLLSHRSEDDQVESLGFVARIQTLAALLLALVGAGLVVAGLSAGPG